MGRLSDEIEDVLRNILRSEAFVSMWENWQKTTRIATHGDRANWEVVWPAALTLVAATGLWDAERFAWSADTWQRIMLEMELIG